MGTISSNVRRAFVRSFQHKCITLVCQAHDELCSSNTIAQDMDEEKISMCIATIIGDSQQALEWMIHIDTEHRLPCMDYIRNPTSSKSLKRIDFRYEMDVWDNDNPGRLRFYMEAKNLYQVDFKKPFNSSITNAKASFKRYIVTGIGNITTGDYPSNTLLLGYVLVGDIDSVVKGVNTELSSLNRCSEHLIHISTCYENHLRKIFCSQHSDMFIKHLMLKF